MTERGRVISLSLPRWSPTRRIDMNAKPKPKPAPKGGKGSKSKGY